MYAVAAASVIIMLGMTPMGGGIKPIGGGAETAPPLLVVVFPAPCG
jgi:hypothetical protein